MSSPRDLVLRRRGMGFGMRTIGAGILVMAMRECLSESIETKSSVFRLINQPWGKQNKVN